jgi:integrase
MKMARRKTLTDVGVAALKARKTRYVHADPEARGHYIRIHPSGRKSYTVVTRDHAGKQVWSTIGDTTAMDIDQAREKAREIVAGIKSGKKDAGPSTFSAVAEGWFKREVIGRGFISGPQTRSYLDRILLPAWGAREFTSIRRIDVANLLDDVADATGPASADSVLGVIRSICNWYSGRDETYVSPIARRMRRVKEQEHARSRILDDAELRQVWLAAEANGQFGAFIRLALLTAQRREKILSMKWEDLTDGVWTVPHEGRQKQTGGELRLPTLALEIINAQPKVDGSPYVFPAQRGSGHLSGLSKRKRKFDCQVKIASWTTHDLRRTARSLLSRCPGVLSNVSERVLGHAVGNAVEKIYDRHSYTDEKGEALARLADLIERIVHPPKDNVRHLRGNRG